MIYALFSLIEEFPPRFNIASWNASTHAYSNALPLAAEVFGIGNAFGSFKILHKSSLKTYCIFPSFLGLSKISAVRYIESSKRTPGQYRASLANKELYTLTSPAPGWR